MYRKIKVSRWRVAAWPIQARFWLELGISPLESALQSTPGHCLVPLRIARTCNRLTRTDKRTNITLSYTPYDNIYQLQMVKQGATTKESYTYDLVGNRLSWLDT